MDTTSYVQSAASFFTPETIRTGVSVGPDRKDRISVCPLPRIFTEVPPTSMTSTFLPEGPLASTSLIKDRSGASAGACPIVARPRLAAGDDLALITLAHPLEDGGLGFDHVQGNALLNHVVCGATTRLRNHSTATDPNPPADRPDRDRIFPTQPNFFCFMAYHKAFALTQRVFHLV